MVVLHPQNWLLGTPAGSRAYACPGTLPGGAFLDGEPSMGQNIQFREAANLKSCVGSSLEPGRPGRPALRQFEP